MEILRKPYKKKTSISLIEDLYRICTRRQSSLENKEAREGLGEVE